MSDSSGVLQSPIDRRADVRRLAGQSAAEYDRDDDGERHFETRPDYHSRRPWFGQNLLAYHHLQALRAVVRQKAVSRFTLLRHHAALLLQSRIAANNLRAAESVAAAGRAVRAERRLVRPALRVQLVSDAAQKVRLRSDNATTATAAAARLTHRRPRCAAAAAAARGSRQRRLVTAHPYRRSAPAESVGFRYRGCLVLVAHYPASQHSYHMHDAVLARSAEDDSVAKGTF